MKLHVAGVLVYGSIRTGAVENDGGIGDVAGLEARQAAVAGDLVLEHEVKDEIAAELHALLLQHPHQAEADGGTCLVVHGAAAEDRVRAGVDMAGERRMGPFPGIACRLRCP